jgi:hypothetical protein
MWARLAKTYFVSGGRLWAGWGGLDESMGLPMEATLMLICLLGHGVLLSFAFYTYQGNVGKVARMSHSYE